MQFEVIHGRVAKLRALMREKEMDAFLLIVTSGLNSENCHYISGFRGSSAAIVIDGEREVLITDGRYKSQAEQQSPFALTVHRDLPLTEFVSNLLGESGYGCVGFESERLFHGFVERTLKKIPVNWKEASSLIPSLRRSKDRSEADAIREAGAIARKAFDVLLYQVRPGMTEVEFENRLLYEIKKAGGEKGWSHADFIVVSGARGAMCHGRATDKPFAAGDTVTVDFGAMKDGYMCDITRNFAIGKANSRAQEISEILIKAHHDAVATLRPAVSGKDVDAVARKVVADAGYEKHFVHGLGHGLGLEVHESPRLSEISKDTLQEGDVITIEPGIYIEGWGGLRVEDNYIVTLSGAECLTLSDDQRLSVVG